jgi:hypothetical protein
MTTDKLHQAKITLLDHKQTIDQAIDLLDTIIDNHTNNLPWYEDTAMKKLQLLLDNTTMFTHLRTAIAKAIPANTQSPRAQVKAEYLNKSQRASQHYHAHYDNDLYKAATASSTTKRANRLLNTAMALCEHPHYNLYGEEAIPLNKLTHNEILFLAEFTK